MVLTKRERILAIATILVVGLLALNTIVITPVLNLRRQTSDERIELEAQLEEAQNLFQRRVQLERKWKDLLAGDMQSDADMETCIAKNMNEWARQTGLTLPSIKPERSTNEKGYTEITFVAAGRGSLESVASFLYRIETSELPVRVTNMQLGSSSESGNDMSLQLRVSAICLGDPSKAPMETPQKPQSEKNDEDETL
ncbi:MAG: type 4a pilus biogenesis protein PilO [Solirubrobacterales bacterium]